MSPESDVIVVGAGVAGLAACVELERAGLRVTCVEARDRIGGRILTVRDPFAPLPIELGAEFVHGAPPEILRLAESAGLPLGQIGGDDKYFEKGVWVSSEGEGDDFGPLFDELERYPGPDQSWKDFADSSRATEQAKRAATAYVEGFNAARAEAIGVWSLREDMRAARSIDDRKQFRVSSGYDRIPLRLAGELRDSSRSIRLRSPVERIAWQKGRVAIYCRGVSAPLHARAAVITFPLGVLQECSSEHPPIQFVPNPEQILLAASRLVSGQVFRVVFRFAERFWEQADGLEDPGFLFSEEKTFPTWWTSAPLHAPMLTGWSAGPRAESLQGRSENEIAAEALATLARILPFPADFVADQVRAWYFHDWHADPYARGAYSYTPAGSLGARRELALPVQDTLFFAGEATETEGHSATVHGAIATGRRAAAQVAQTLESNPLR